MNFLRNLIILILVPFIYGYGYVTENLKIRREFKRIKQLAENNFKPFWIETNQIFHEVLTKEQFLDVCLKFKKAYPDLSILDLKISKFDYSIQNEKPVDSSEKLISFGLRGEHIHDIDYTLEDYFLS